MRKQCNNRFTKWCAVAFVAMALSVPVNAFAKNIKVGAILAVTGGASFLGGPEARTIEMLAEELKGLGLKSNMKAQKPVGTALVYHSLKNPFYYGMMTHQKNNILPSQYTREVHYILGYKLSKLGVSLVLYTL